MSSGPPSGSRSKGAASSVWSYSPRSRLMDARRWRSATTRPTSISGGASSTWLSGRGRSVEILLIAPDPRPEHRRTIPRPPLGEGASPAEGSTPSHLGVGEVHGQEARVDGVDLGGGARARAHVDGQAGRALASRHVDHDRLGP